MKRLATLPILLFALFLGACSANSPAISDAQSSPMKAVPVVESRSTVLLVSLDDGTVVKQMIDIDAEICFKDNSSSSTTCLVQGAPIVDPATAALVGFEMIERHIDLVAKTH